MKSYLTKIGLFLKALMITASNILSYGSLQAQIGNYYSSENGLSSNLINDIYQDKRGFVWVATEYGLTRFDALKLTIYKHVGNEQKGLNDNYVRTIFESSSGRLFIGTILGLMEYRLETDDFNEIELIKENKAHSAHVTGMAEMENGDLWISTSGQGLFVLEADKQSAHYDVYISPRLSSIYLNSIHRDSQGIIWIGSESNGINSYNSKTRKIRQFKAPDEISGNNISAIAEDHDGNLFVGTLTKGLNRYKRESNSFIPVPSKSKNQFIYSLMVSHDNLLLIGTDGQGLKSYNREKNLVEDFNTNLAPFDFSKSKVHVIFEDNKKDIWLGLFQKGVLHIPAEQNRFDYYGYRSINHNLIGSNSVTSMTKDRMGKLWIATDNDGLYGLDEQTNKLVHFYQTESTHSVPDIILCTFEDSEANLWIAAYMKGLARVDHKTGRCEFIQQLSNEKVYYIAEDKEKHLLIATLGSGLFMLDIKSGKIEHYESSKQEENNWSRDELCNDWVNCVLCDSEGLIWIGHYKGLSCFNPQKNTFINYKNTNNLLPCSIVTALCEDSYGAIWIGTSTELHRFDKISGEMKNIPLQNNQHGEMICGICEDNEGKIWFSTYKGIYKFDPDLCKFWHYYAGNGLPDNEFSRGAVFKDHKGKLYFGGTNGVTSFYPADISEPHCNSPLHLTAFYVANKAIKRGSMSGKHEIITSSVLDADTFQLSHKDNTFTLEFSNFDFVNAKNTIYEYKMQEIQSEWIALQPGINQLTYSSLPSGEYQFSVRVSNIPDSQKTIIIKIDYPWYQTKLAKTFFAIFVLSFIAIIINFIRLKIRHRHEQIIKEQRQKLDEAKLQFFTNISHEIRTPMTLIINPIEKLMKSNHDKKTHQTYTIIYRNAQRILHLVNQLLDVRKLDKGQICLGCRETDIVGFIEDLMQAFAYMAQQKNTRFSFDADFKELKVWIDLNHFDKVMLNVLSNAFKFTSENGEIIIKLSTGEDDKRLSVKKYFEIRVIDDGIGINVNNIERIFERFYQENQTYSDVKFGTGIGLHLSRELVKLHHGIIYAEPRNDSERGIQMVIRLPMGNEHLKPEELETSETAAMRMSMYYGSKSVELMPENDTKSKPSRAKTKYKVLVVEDEDELRKYIMSELSVLYRVAGCSNGKEAFELILRDRFDAVISDIMMPIMDGIALTYKVKQNININHIPIILLTAKAQEKDQAEGLEIGADAYITKPFNTNFLEQTVNNLISNREILRKKFSGEQEYGNKIARIEMKSADEILMNKVLKIISDNLSNSELTVEFLADSVGMSRVHIHRKLKELTNQSAHDFIRGIRMKQAALLLSEKKFGIADIAYATGFRNVSHFSASFKAFYGVSPSDYIESLKSNDIN
ncbi:MAG: response regulator [Prevotellaceae bacterium]|jgi:signal transduction histidine kinase/ligand-binding sensor domain-containing protein/DNA-binding response OmpR family regulator|nr:response regulator [Prevotellaceae bacterium]